jgi:hypothetical protein
MRELDLPTMPRLKFVYGHGVSQWYISSILGSIYGDASTCVPGKTGY